MAQIIDCRTTRTTAPLLCWRNVIPDASPSSGAAAAQTYATYEGFEPGSADTTARFTFSEDQTLDYIAVLCIGAEASDNSTPPGITVSTSTDGGSTYTLVDSSTNDTSGYPMPPTWPAYIGLLLFVFDERTDVDVIEIRVTNGNGIDGFRIANVMAGQRTELERNIYVGHQPATYGRRTTLASNVAENGSFLGRITRRRAQATAVQMANITPSFFRDELDEFFVAAESQPFVFAWRPSAETYLPVVQNGSFENGTTGMGGTGLSTGSVDAFGGSDHALLLGSSGEVITSTRLTVRPGDLVSALLWARDASGASFSQDNEINISWYDDGGSFIQDDAASRNFGTSYAQHSLTTRAPEGATQVAMKFRSYGATGGDISYVDSMNLYVPRAHRLQRLNEVSWCWMQGDPQSPNQRPNGMQQIQFNLVGLEQ